MISTCVRRIISPPDTYFLLLWTPGKEANTTTDQYNILDPFVDFLNSQCKMYSQKNSRHRNVNMTKHSIKNPSHHYQAFSNGDRLHYKHYYYYLSVRKRKTSPFQGCTTIKAVVWQQYRRALDVFEDSIKKSRAWPSPFFVSLSCSLHYYTSTAAMLSSSSSSLGECFCLKFTIFFIPFITSFVCCYWCFTFRI